VRFERPVGGREETVRLAVFRVALDLFSFDIDNLLVDEVSFVQLLKSPRAVYETRRQIVLLPSSAR